MAANDTEPPSPVRKPGAHNRSSALASGATLDIAPANYQAAPIGGNRDRLPSTLRLGDLASADSSSGLQGQIAAWQEELDEFGILITLASQMLVD